ncbi:MAG: V-type ATP synthase subunit E family protein [Candidatus Nanohaloarchaea archaeon]|nr:V-type ATP synthase subunit E family protein [Candidatus Nanohaloarchaea archaeon]
MALDKVKQEILDEAEDKAERIIEEAEEEADDIVSEAEQKADDLEAQARQEAEDRAEALKKQKKASAKMEARQKKMEAKQDVIDQAFTLLEDRVRNMDQDDRKELFQRVLDRISDETTIGTVHCSEEMVNAVDDMVNADVQAADIDGIIVEDADGSVRYDYSFDTVLENVRNEHRKDVAKELF